MRFYLNDVTRMGHIFPFSFTFFPRFPPEVRCLVRHLRATHHRRLCCCPSLGCAIRAALMCSGKIWKCKVNHFSLASSPNERTSFPHFFSLCFSIAIFPSSASHRHSPYFMYDSFAVHFLQTFSFEKPTEEGAEGRNEMRTESASKCRCEHCVY